GHFLGNNTVIDVLRQAGLEVEHTPAGQTIHRTGGCPAPPTASPHLSLTAPLGCAPLPDSPT
ncbi:hypothetical protein PANDA_017730, partial [Ailuropoda melanoleuca]